MDDTARVFGRRGCGGVAVDGEQRTKNNFLKCSSFIAQYSTVYRKPSTVKIETPRLLIRPFSLADAEDFFELESDPRLLEYELYPPKSRVESDAALKKLLIADLHPDIQNWREWAITLKQEGIVIGLICMAYHDIRLRIMEVGFRVKFDWQGKGYGSEALRGLIEAVFQQTETHRIFACTDGLNAASQRMMEKVGMQKEAWLREHVLVAETYHDEVIFGILRRELGKETLEHTL